MMPKSSKGNREGKDAEVFSDRSRKKKKGLKITGVFMWTSANAALLHSGMWCPVLS